MVIMNTTEATKSISLPFLKKNGYFDNCIFQGKLYWWTRGEPNGNISILVDSRDNATNHMTLDYTITQRDTGESEDVILKIPLHFSVPNYGGKRWIAECPLFKNGVYCGNRVRVLFQAGNYFGCRSCAGVIYESQTVPERHRGYPWNVYDLEDKEKSITRKYHKGKPTKRYQRFLNKWDKHLSSEAKIRGLKALEDLL